MILRFSTKTLRIFHLQDDFFGSIFAPIFLRVGVRFGNQIGAMSAAKIDRKRPKSRNRSWMPGPSSNCDSPKRPLFVALAFSDFWHYTPFWASFGLDFGRSWAPFEDLECYLLRSISNLFGLVGLRYAKRNEFHSSHSPDLD